MEHYSFEFWILISFESWWCDLGLPKEGRSGKEEDIIRNTVLGRVGGILGICSRKP
jgi:hypothetical protein